MPPSFPVSPRQPPLTSPRSCRFKQPVKLPRCSSNTNQHQLTYSDNVTALHHQTRDVTRSRKVGGGEGEQGSQTCSWSEGAGGVLRWHEIVETVVEATMISVLFWNKPWAIYYTEIRVIYEKNIHICHKVCTVKIYKMCLLLNHYTFVWEWSAKK